MGDGMLSLYWNNHKATFCHILSTLRERERYTDVTLACQGKFYQVHKLVLSACSEYFESMFENTPCKHPVIVLKDIKPDDIEALLSYMYAGVVSVAQNDLARLIKAAELLQIKGLAVPDEPPLSPENRKVRVPKEDRTSPPPKRKKREENGQANINISPPSSPQHIQYEDTEYRPRPSRSRSYTDTQQSEPPPRSRTYTETQQSETPPRSRTYTDTQQSEPPPRSRTYTDTQQSEPPPEEEATQPEVKVLVDESLVKEEIQEIHDDSLDKDDSQFYSQDVGDSSLDRIQNEDGSSLHDSQNVLPGQSQPLSDAVAEALAGPSGMQGWLSGDLGNHGFENYGDSENSQLGQQQMVGSGYMHPAVPHMTDVATTAQLVTTTASAAANVSSSAGIFSAMGASSMIHMEDPQNRGRSVNISMATELTHPVKGLFKSTQQQKLDYVPKRGRPSKSKMDVHISEKYLRCAHCPFSTLYPNNLARHQNKHTGARPYSCPECPYAAMQKEHLTTHMRRHTGERPYKCPHCPYEAARQDRLNAHLKIHTRDQASLLATQSSPEQPGTSSVFHSDPDADISAPLDMSAPIERHTTEYSPDNSLRYSPNQITMDNPEHSSRQSLRMIPRTSYEDYNEISNEDDD